MHTVQLTILLFGLANLIVNVKGIINKGEEPQNRWRKHNDAEPDNRETQSSGGVEVGKKHYWNGIELPTRAKTDYVAVEIDPKKETTGHTIDKEELEKINRTIDALFEIAEKHANHIDRIDNRWQQVTKDIEMNFEFIDTVLRMVKEMDIILRSEKAYGEWELKEIDRMKGLAERISG